MKRQSIAIVGAGTAGLATAIVLAKQGHDITIFEQVSKMENVGAGLLLQPSGMAVFEHLGALEHALDLGAPIDALKGWSKGSLLLHSRYAEVSPKLTGLGMHRAALCDVLMQQLKHYNVRWSMATAVRAVIDHQDHMQVHVSSDQTQNSVNFDAVLVANGARSHLRPKAWTRLDQPYPWGAVWAIVPETTSRECWDYCQQDQHRKLKASRSPVFFGVCRLSKLIIGSNRLLKNFRSGKTTSIDFGLLRATG
jgi:2-polyprenyl-6-methoxyphenol hydroxylase-like FAD-dependent oxidoreductase